MVRVRFVTVAVALGLTALACASSTDESGVIQTPPASAASCQLPAGAQDHGTEAAPGATLTLEADDTFFAQTCVTGVASGTVTITIHNGGKALHNFSVPILKIDKDVAVGSSVTVSLEAPAGSVSFFCKYHKSAGMVGELVTS